MNNVTGHIIHPYEDLDLTIQDIINILDLNITNVKEKFDGQNILFSMTNSDRVLFARSRFDIQQKVNDTDFINKIRYDNFKESLRKLSRDLLYFRSCTGVNEYNAFFKNGEKFLSAEIIDSKNPNLMLYDKNYIILHGILDSITMVMNNNISSTSYKSMDYFDLKINNKIDMLNYKQFITSEFLKNSLSLFKISVDKKLRDLEEFVYNEIVDECMKQEQLLLKNMMFGHNLPLENQTIIQNLRTNQSIYIQSKELEELYKQLSRRGGFNNLSSIEGIVFNYNTKLYKMTGLFPILNKLNYKMRVL